MGVVIYLLRAPNEELEAFLQDEFLLDKTLNELNCQEDSDRLGYLDKAWDAILFLLTGKGSFNNEHLFGKIFSSGQVIPGDLGMGEAEYLTVDQVKEINDKLCLVNLEELKNRYKPLLMYENDIYPTRMWTADNVSYVMYYFEKLRDFFALAAKNKEVVITHKG